MRLLIGLILCASAAWAQACSGVPVITNYTATVIDATSVTLAWDTNCLADTSGMWADFGSDEPDQITSITDAGGSLSHSVTVTGLYPAIAYEFWARSQAVNKPNAWSWVGWTYGSAVSPNQPSPLTRTTAAVPAGTLDYVTIVTGSHEVYQGSQLWLTVRHVLTQGTDSNTVQVTVTGIPANTTLSPGAMTCSPVFTPPATMQTFRLKCTSSAINFALVTTDSTPLGPATLTFTTHVLNGPADHVDTFDIEVMPKATFNFWAPTSYPVVPCKTSASTQIGGAACSYNWQDEMLYGINQWCTDPILLGTEQKVWYYDGGWQMYKTRAWDAKYSLSGNPSQWDTCVNFQISGYRDYVIANGMSNAWRLFADGMRTDYLATGNTDNVTGLQQFRTGSFYNMADQALISIYYTRELAYRMDAEVIDNELFNDGTRLANLTKAFYIQLGRPDQWAKDPTHLRPFMAGLWAESLIKCYDTPNCPFYQDVRIPASIKKVADLVWTQTWDKVQFAGNRKMFCYSRFRCDTYTAWWYDAVINQLISSMYAWLWSLSGDSAYKDKADLAFQEGVQSGSPHFFNGKEWSQNYRMSFNFIRWREAPAYDANIRRRVLGGKTTPGGKIN